MSIHFSQNKEGFSSLFHQYLPLLQEPGKHPKNALLLSSPPLPALLMRAKRTAIWIAHNAARKSYLILSHFLMMPASMMAAVVSAATITAALPCTLVRTLSHTGIVAVTVGMIISAIALTSVGVLSCQGTSLHMADPDNAAGTVAITVFMGISAVCLAVVGVITSLRTAFHSTYPDHAAGTVAVTGRMIMAAVHLAVVKVIARLRTTFHSTYADSSAGTVTVTSRMGISTVSRIVMCVQPGSRTTIHRTHGTYRIIRGTCLTMMSMS